MANSIEIIPNKLVIEQVSASPYWRMRFKVNGKWIGKTTKRKDQAEAAEFARQEFTERELLEKHGIYNTVSTTVSDVSKIYYQRLVDAQTKGTAKPTYKAYQSVITKYIDPIAGKWDIRAVSNTKMDEYFSACESIIGRQPAKGTINTHNVVWRQIFRIAQDRRWMTADDIPRLTIKDKGRVGQRRPAFSLDEYVQLRRFLRTYHLSADRFSSEYRRQLLREYCIFLFATGMRPGREVLGLQWKHIKFDGGPSPVAIVNPQGKTGDRPTVAMNFIKPSLRRLKKLTNHTEPDDFVFATPNGEAAKGMSHLVSRALTDAGLRYDPLGKARTAYSFRHTYATMLRVYRDFSFDELAENMGNSVEMIQRHYYQAKTTDRASRYATGRGRRTQTDRKVDIIHEMLKQKFSSEFHDTLRSMLDENQFEDDYIALRAVEIEMERWQADASTKDRNVAENMDYILEFAVNRYEEFMNGDSFG
ncbi:hypothetical protein N8000_05225 [Rhodospirillales bacterium]|nr:hypothetical protein [Rhodospirillales bacterium]